MESFPKFKSRFSEGPRRFLYCFVWFFSLVFFVLESVTPFPCSSSVGVGPFFLACPEIRHPDFVLWKLNADDYNERKIFRHRFMDKVFFSKVWEPSTIVSIVFGVHSTKYHCYLVYFHYYLHLVNMFSLLMRHLGFVLNSILFSLFPLVFRLLCFVLELRKIIVTSVFQCFPEQNTECEAAKSDAWWGTKVPCTFIV